MMGKTEVRVSQARNGERGQVLPLVAAAIIALFGLSALVIDTGNLYVSYQELLAATDAAALAGGANIPNGTAVTTATQYSAVSGDLNAGHPTLNTVAVTPTLECLTSTILPACSVYGTQTSANAIKVTETAAVPVFFAHIFGRTTFNISATATASAKGGNSGPFNIVMVLDTTSSMNDNDSDCGNVSQEQCALGGIRTFLAELDPCYSNQNPCPSPNTNPVDNVALMAFPGLCSTALTGGHGLGSGTCPAATSVTTSPGPTASDDYACPGGTNPNITSYNNDPAYDILPYQNNYRNSDSAGLNTSSDIVIAAGGATHCQGMQAPGGEGTFYAGAINAAQAYLTANARTNVQNVMIILSDGDANATGQDMAGTATTYPQTQECHQAVTAADNAKAAGTQIYSVSYGSETSGCSTDTSPTITPCTTMYDMASAPQSTYFFSNAASGGSTVCAGGRANSSLTNVFQQIGADLTVARLIPNNTP